MASRQQALAPTDPLERRLSDKSHQKAKIEKRTLGLPDSREGIHQGVKEALRRTHQDQNNGI